MKAKYYKINLSELRKKIKYLEWTLLGLLGVIILLAVAFGIYSLIFTSKAYGHSYLGAVDLKGKTKTQTEEIVKNSIDQYLKTSITLKGPNDYIVNLAELGINYNAESTVNEIWQYGRSGNIINSAFQQFISMFKSRKLAANFSIDENLLSEKINSIAKEIDIPEKDFSLVYNGEKFVLDDERQEGRRIDKAEISSQITEKVGRLDNSVIFFEVKEYKPEISPEKAKSCLDRANRIISTGDLILYYETQEFVLEADSIAAMIKSKKSNGDLEIVFDDDRIKLFSENVAKAIDSEPQNVQLKFENNSAIIDKSSKNGMTLDLEKTKSDIKGALISRTTEQISDQRILLKVEIKKPEISEENLESLGLKELIGRGETNFIKSPTNRIHNINVGASAINGALIKPGGTFSTLSKLGSIDAASGYLEELVIKEDRTVPEFGGGLCQVSSTLFRAALNAGMNIVERRNHKYRVSYYEPPIGMDATIYDPSPDFKFKNSYGSHILIQAKVVGTKISFELYGTKDSRVVEISEPEVFDYTDPGPPVTIETETMAPGERKQIEKAHQGASAKFRYKVAKDGNVLQEKEFFSKYIPWPEKWLVGKGVPETTANCQDSAQNGDEAGVDCGGSCPNACS